MTTLQADIRYTVPPGPRQVVEARRRAWDLLTCLGVDSDRADVTEHLVRILVDNAVRHAGCDPEVRISVDRTVRVEVYDTDPTPVTFEWPDESQAGSLWDVTEDADRYGCEPAESGKRVWFEINARDSGDD